MPAGYTYIMGSTTGTIYIGVTSKFFVRVMEHKRGHFEGFAKEYGCVRLLYFEKYEDVRYAIRREKQLKGWRREKKLNLIREKNLEFKDLAEEWGWELLGPNQRMRPEGEG